MVGVSVGISFGRNVWRFEKGLLVLREILTHVLRARGLSLGPGDKNSLLAHAAHFLEHERATSSKVL